MSSIDIELLQSQIEGLDSCGEDLEYDPDFMALQQATAGKCEQQFGATIIPAEPPDWTRVERMATQLCRRTCDVRIMVPLTLAWTEIRGLPGYVDGLQLVAAMLESSWDDLHPRIVSGDLEDPMPRMNALAALTETEGIGRSVRDARLLEDGGSSVSLRQVEALLDSSKTDQLDYPGGISRLRDAARRAYERAAPPVVALHQSLGLLRRIRETSERALGQSWAPDFSRLERSLHTASQLLPEQAQTDSVTALQLENSTGTKGALDSARNALGAVPGIANGASHARSLDPNDIEVSSRKDVQTLLAKACDYMERAEPSHPAPLLIRRAQHLLALNFFELIEELLPEGLEKMESLAGRRSSEGNAVD